MGAEYVAANSPATRTERRRYRKVQWSGHKRWEVYSQGGEKWFGFESVRELAGLPPEILMVPLPGHSLGHAGVAIHRGGKQWLLHGGDSFFFHREIDPDKPTCPWSLRLFQELVQADAESRDDCQARLRDLMENHRSEVTVLCSHDWKIFETLRSASGGSGSKLPT
jgi:glyoxylase-like metal-dependent hydrolase (beta-lactamase superfamily II)